jgi:hypothetical protein
MACNQAKRSAFSTCTSKKFIYRSGADCELHLIQHPLHKEYPMRFFRSTIAALFLAWVAVPAFTLAASAQIVISIGVPPPPLPDYDQPVIPAPGYIWTPGYWAYDDDYGYYWVPGTWVLAPEAGLLWTPGYWAFEDGNYVYYDGYWGPEVGYYGGVDYGYGYTGDGYEGGHWQGGTFFYNRTVNNITDVNITNVYSKTIVEPTTINRVAYNGGAGGTTARPTEQQQAFAHERHVPPTDSQRTHVQLASHDPSLREAENKGRPPIAATSRPQDFKGPGVIAAKTAGIRPHDQSIPQGKKGPAQPPGLTLQPNATGQEQTLEKSKMKQANPENALGEPNKPGALPNEHGAIEHGAKVNTGVNPATHAVPPHPAMQPRPAMPPHPHPEAQPHPAMAPHPEAQPHPQMQPHPQQMMQRPAAPPRPQGQPHPAGGDPEEHKKPGQP